MGNLGSFTAIPFLCLIFSALLVGGCANPREDVRVTLCKDILLTRPGSSMTLAGVSTEMKGREQAAVRVRFSAGGRETQATCYYEYQAVDDTALILSDPLSAFATSPSAVVIDGRKLSRQELAMAIKEAMVKQARELFHAR